MDNSAKKLLQLMFRPGETICVSNSKFGYHSVYLESVLNDKQVTLIPTEESCIKRGIVWSSEVFESVDTSKLILCALNPIKGFRLDENVTNFRNFLIEMDTGTIEAQIDYINKIGLPYSAMVFSGSKSVHTLVSLSNDLPDEKSYRMVAEWILNIATMADPNTKNPSRSIRIPGAERSPGKFQELLQYKGPVKLKDLSMWLDRYPGSKPKVFNKKKPNASPDLGLVKGWIAKLLKDGIDPSKGRNKQWFVIACEFATAGFSEEDTIDKLRSYFVPDKDFREREWLTSIRSAFKHVYRRK